MMWQTVQIFSLSWQVFVFIFFFVWDHSFTKMTIKIFFDLFLLSGCSITLPSQLCPIPPQTIWAESVLVLWCRSTTWAWSRPWGPPPADPWPAGDWRWRRICATYTKGGGQQCPEQKPHQDEFICRSTDQWEVGPRMNFGRNIGGLVSECCWARSLS